MSDQKSFAPSFPIARLEKRTSAKGTEYYSGYLGGARITLLKSNETGRDGAEVWHLMVAEGKMFPAKSVGGGDGNAGQDRGRQTATASAKRHFAKPRETGERGIHHMSAEHSEIPF